MSQVVSLWRHPIKSHGREALEQVALHEGQTMPWDRTWAIAHEQSRADETAWARCANFSRVAKAPELMAITAKLDEAAQTVTLRHPGRPEITFAPDTEPQDFLDWVAPLMPADRAQSARIVRVPGRGMTDSDFPSITIGNMKSHKAVEQKLGRDLSLHRWRCNIWLDGDAPWEEFDWIDAHIRIGTAEMRIVQRTTRCMATTANPDTGKRDADTLGTLATWGHEDFCVYAVVTKSGTVRLGDGAALI